MNTRPRLTGTKRTKSKSKQPLKRRRTQYNMVPRTGGFYSPSSSREKKFIDSSFTLSLPFGATTWVAPAPASLVNGLVPGSAATQRIGRRVTFRSIYIRGKLAFGASVTNSCQARYLVVYDKQSNATAFNTTDLLLNDDYLSPNNISNKDRFVVLADKVTASVDAAQTKQISFKCYKKIRLDTMYNTGTAGTIGDITSGAIYVIAAQSGGAGVANPSMQFQVRLRYDDV